MNAFSWTIAAFLLYLLVSDKLANYLKLATVTAQNG